MEHLDNLTPGMRIPFGGDRVATVSPELAEAFRGGDRLIVVQETGDLLHIPESDWITAREAVAEASAAFGELQRVADRDVTAFYEAFASRLEDDIVFAPIAAANQADVSSATDAGRSTTRLVLTARMRADMIAGLRLWASVDTTRKKIEQSIQHQGWRLDLIRSGLGVVGFVFEGRPNVIADATGVLRSGNTAVFRIGSAALATARAIIEHALAPALVEAGLPGGSVSLVDSPSRAAGWAMFADPRLGLAIARGSGQAVAQLGAVARQSGTPVSLHGTGGSWLVAAESASPDDLASAIYNSLDRKVCNTLNTVCVVQSRAPELVPVVIEALDRAARARGAEPKLHVTDNVAALIPAAWFDDVPIERAEGTIQEPKTETVADEDLGVEWEWENSPEITLTLVAGVDEAISAFNTQSPRFGASLISSDPAEHDRFFDLIDSPFVGNGFTRWVDGQFAMNRPELGLSNWQFGRLFGRGGILSGDSVYTVRARAHQDDPDLSR